jgi:UDP-GlcNAc:undecaprenyl-phosphate GlcNAc-1-phosphate transferase
VIIFIANGRGWKIKRYAIIDKAIKGPLRKFREEQVIIKISFKAAEIGFMSLLILMCFLPRQIPVYFSLFSLLLLAVNLIFWRFKKNTNSFIIEIAIFLMIPFLVYFNEANVLYLRGTFLLKAYSVSFGALIIFALLTLKFTRRHGFKTTPMDFLILLIALVLPNLPDEQIRSWQMGFVATKIIVLFFTYEILKGEMRMNISRLIHTGITALIIISFRGLLN